MPLQDFMELYKSDHFLKRLRNMSGSYTVRAAVVSDAITVDNPVPFTHYVTGVCHACVCGEMGLGNKDYVITLTNPEFAKNKGALIFYDWLFNYSKLRDVFLIKDPVLALQQGIVKRTDVDAKLFLAACQLARLTTSEFRTRFEAVCMILEEGYEIHPMFLLVIAVSLAVEVKSAGADKPPYYGSEANTDSKARGLLGYPTSHLPIPYAAPVISERGLQAYCDNEVPDKVLPAATYKVMKHWPANSSNALFASKAQFTSLEALPRLAAFVTSTPCFVGSKNEKRTETVVAPALWQSAIDRLKTSLAAASLSGKNSFFDVKKLELFSKKLNLGASNA